MGAWTVTDEDQAAADREDWEDACRRLKSAERAELEGRVVDPVAHRATLARLRAEVAALEEALS